ncbi:28S rRNA (cytosine-C(5))-methyltransferase-like [Saccoglossus kowalevskii]
MLYTQAARVIESTQEQKGSLKSLVFASKAKNQKQLYALVCETLKFRDIINTIVKETALFKREKFLKKNPVLAQVLVYEFLFGKGIRCSGKMKNVIMSHKAALQASLTRIKIKQQVSKNQDLLPKDVTQQGNGILGMIMNIAILGNGIVGMIINITISGNGIVGMIMNIAILGNGIVGMIINITISGNGSLGMIINITIPGNGIVGMIMNITISGNGILGMIMNITISGNGILGMIMNITILGNGILGMIINITISGNGIVGMIINITISGNGILGLIINITISGNGILGMIINITILGNGILGMIINLKISGNGILGMIMNITISGNGILGMIINLKISGNGILGIIMNITMDGYQCVSSLKKKQFMKDLHFDDLLVFAPNTDLHDNVLYQQGDIILQDKASCIPAHVLCPPLGSHVIDTCAAPGNKTSHLASIINNTGKIYAFDLDTKRIGTMGNLTAKAGVMNTQLFNQDFLKTNPTDNKFQKVEYILVDPSCTGSGIVNRNDHLMGAQGITKARLRSLSSFQVMILKHAMEFPNLKRVVYSTCSVHREENEDVVAEVLKCNKNFALKTVMPSWTHRGLEGTDVGKHCIRASANVDFTNGFFVALFERTEMKFEKQAAFDDRRGDTSEKFAHDGNGDDTPQKGCRYEEDNLSTTRTKPDVTASVQRTVGVKRASDSVGKKKKKKRKKQFKPVTAK